ncbi:MAG TPA: c-type cytochrome domain-containing protein [Pirellulales bacterium]
MSYRFLPAVVLATLLLGGAVGAADSVPPADRPAAPQDASHDTAKVEFFEKKIRPLLASACYDCHSANTKPAGGLRVDDRNGLLSGGERGAAIAPGKPEASLLLKAVTHTAEKLKMPPDNKLSDEQVADLTKWIADGAAWPGGEEFVPGEESPEHYEKLKKEHWAWQPRTAPTPPAVADESQVRDDVDRFVLAKLGSTDIQSGEVCGQA